MRKYMIWILACVMLLTLAAAGAEEDVSSALTGDWYTDLSGVPVQMTLEEEGDYTLVLPGYAPEKGTWEPKDGFVYLNGTEPPDLTVFGEKLLWNELLAFFTREKVDSYVPAELAEDVPENICDGYWKCVYVDVEGTPIAARAIGDKTDLYVEGTTAILGGLVFRDAQVKMENADSGLKCEVEGAAVRLQLQEDSLLRMTLTFEGEDMIWYLLPASAGVPETGN